MLGSPQYVSPEQVQDAAHVSAATDVYGLGATLYAALTGRPPFQGTTVADTLHKVKYEEPKPPRRVNPAVDRDLNTITLKCLDKEPGRRFASAAEVADELRLYLDGLPIRTRPIGPAGRLWLWSRRKPLVAALSAAAVVLLGVLSLAVWAWSSASHSWAVADQKLGKSEEELTKTKGDVRRIEGERNEQAAGKKALDYIKDIRRAQQHVNARELSKAREILALWKPQEGEVDHRAWEWHFLNAQCRESGFTVRGHTSGVKAVAWKPDGTQVASGDDQGIVKVWDVATGKELRELKTQAGGVLALAWNSDGNRLSAACSGITQPAGGAFPQPGLPANGLPAPPGGLPQVRQPGQQLPGAGGLGGNKPPAGPGQGTVQIWDADTGKAMPSLKMAAGVNLAVHPLALPLPANADQEAVQASRSLHNFLGTWNLTMSWSPAGQKLALADAVGKIQIWDVGTGKDPLVLTAHQGGVYSLAWSPDGKRLASVGGDALVKIWDAAGGNTDPTCQNRMTYDSMMPTSYALTWTEGGKRLSVASGDNEIRILDADLKLITTRKLITRDTMVRGGLTGAPMRRFIWSPDGKWLASVGSQNDGVTLWDATTGQEGQLIRAPGAAAPMIGLPSLERCPPAWDSDSRRLASGWGDGTIQAIRTDSNREPVRSPIRSALAWSRNSKHLWGGPDEFAAAAGGLKAAQAQGRDVMEALRKATERGLTAPPDPGTFLKGGGVVDQRPKHQIQPSDAVTGAVIRTFGKGDAQGVSLPNGLAESPDGKWLASATRAGSLQLWPIAGGEPVILEGPGSNQNTGGRILICWNPKSNQLAASSISDKAVRLWDPVTHKAVKTLNGHEQPLRSLAWSADGKLLASADDGGTVRVWDAATGKESAPSFTFYVKSEASRATAKPAAPSMLSWCRDGRRLAVAGEEESIQIRDVDAGEWVATLHGHPSAKDIHDVICAVAWSPDGKRVAGRSPDEAFLIWDAATGQEILTLRLRPRESFNEPGMMPGEGGMLAWNPDGSQLAFFASGGHVTIWDATSMGEK
jgi:WD40 repeat protein